MRHQRHLRERRNEGGAVAVFVAICAVLIFASAAYAVDAGNVWATRRNATTATDAAALASAMKYAMGENGCATTASASVAANLDSSTLESCTSRSTGADTGYAIVKARTTADYTFAGIFGMDDKDVHAVTTAEWGIPLSATGLRPFGICISSSPQLKTWLNSPAGPTGTSGSITIPFNKSPSNICGSSPGNWGVLDFNGGSNSSADAKEWTNNGYPGEVLRSPPSIAGDTGSFSGLQSELGGLRTSGQFFALALYDSVSGNGSNAKYNIVGFVSARLVDYKTSPANQSSLTLIFERAILSGSCCSSSGIDSGARAVRICDVDSTSPETADPRSC